MTPREQRTAREHEAAIGRAILEARRVAATPEAKELHRRTGGKHGGWTREDEARLREGVASTPGGLYRLRGGS